MSNLPLFRLYYLIKMNKYNLKLYMIDLITLSTDAVMFLISYVWCQRSAHGCVTSPLGLGNDQKVVVIFPRTLTALCVHISSTLLQTWSTINWYHGMNGMKTCKISFYLACLMFSYFIYIRSGDMKEMGRRYMWISVQRCM